MYYFKKNPTRDAATQVRREPEVSEWARTTLRFEADATQTRVLNSRSKRVLLNCTRQWGKSTVTAAKAVHEAHTHAGSLTIAISPTARQTGEFLRKAEGFVVKLGNRPKGDGDNEMSLAFSNGSRIVGLPGTEATVRGFSAVALLLVDEASRVDDDLYRAIRPMLAVSDGTLWLMSTPFGKRGFFYEEWANGGDAWERVSVRAEECPRIPASFLAEERRAQGERWFRQEYGCEFVDSTSGVFDRDLVEAAFSSEFEPLKI
jgi:Terminase large subunit, T4likevirus-type, N-terminal